MTQKPETQAGKDLLEIVKFLNSLSTHYEKQIFFKWLERFEERHAKVVNERTYARDQKDQASGRRWWYTHKNLRLAFRTLKGSLPNFFFYLDDQSIPKDTNGLEAEFTHLKTKLNMHRGLSRKRRANFVAWYWYLKSIKNK